MRAQDFADKSANLFLYGLPIAVVGIPALAFVAVNFAEAAIPYISPLLSVLALMAYLGIPIVGFLGACVGLWCYFKKDYEYKVSKQVLVVAILVVYIFVGSIAEQAYRAMKHETSLPPTMNNIA